MTPLLDARGLVKHVGGRRVVDRVDLACRAGEVHGPNDADKTTTLRMLYGFLEPDAGRIVFDGADVGASARRTTPSMPTSACSCSCRPSACCRRRTSRFRPLDLRLRRRRVLGD